MNSTSFATWRLAIEYQSGNAKEAWDKLKVEYEPTTISSYIKIKKQFNDLKLGNRDNPTTLLSNLGTLRDWLAHMKHPISDEDLCIHIIGNLPMKYRTNMKNFEK